MKSINNLSFGINSLNSISSTQNIGFRGNFEYQNDRFQPTNPNLKYLEKYSKLNWNKITPKQNFVPFDKKYIYRTYDGSKIKVDNPNDTTVYENPKAKEISVIGAKGANIKLQDAEILNLYNSNVEKLSTKNEGGSVFLTESEIFDTKASKADIFNLDWGKGLTVVDGPDIEEPHQINPELASCGRFCANVLNYPIESIEDMINDCIFNSEEKAKIQKLYNHLIEIGAKDFIDSHPHVFKGMINASYSENLCVLDYNNLTKDEFAVIKEAFDKFENGEIKPEWSKAANDRTSDSIPYFLFNYIDTPSEFLPIEGIKEPNSHMTYYKTDDILNWLSDGRNLRECLNHQSSLRDLKVIRTDSYNVFCNYEIAGKNIAELLHNGKYDEAVELLNSKTNGQNQKFTFKNFVGTKLSLNRDKEKDFGSSIKWNIEVPKGTKGLFLAGVIPENLMLHEGEFLLQMGSEFDIKKAEYQNGTLYIDAKVSTP